MAMFKCPYCKFDAMGVGHSLEWLYCPVCGYIQGRQEPSSEQVSLAKRILKIAPKLNGKKFPFELDEKAPQRTSDITSLVKRPEIINWLMLTEKHEGRQ